MRKYDTCFFERYAQISLGSLLGCGYGSLENRDRPDLQSPDGKTMGIEVTRAMEESRDAAKSLLKEIAGVSPMEEDLEDMSRIVISGYAFGLQEGKYIGEKELGYWIEAIPLKTIIRRKVAKVTDGFYGKYDKMGLFIFCKDNISDSDVVEACRYAMELQKGASIKYDTLYLYEISSLHVCNLAEGRDDMERIVSLPVTQELRKEFYLKALWDK